VIRNNKVGFGRKMRECRTRCGDSGTEKTIVETNSKTRGENKSGAIWRELVSGEAFL
jgi:hypothetical protein